MYREFCRVRLYADAPHFAERFFGDVSQDHPAERVERKVGVHSVLQIHAERPEHRGELVHDTRLIPLDGLGDEAIQADDEDSAT